MIALQATLACQCPMCGNTSTLEVRSVDLQAYKSGNVLIQDAFPYLSPDERELILTGICTDCFDSLWEGDE